MRMFMTSAALLALLAGGCAQMNGARGDDARMRTNEPSAASTTGGGAQGAGTSDTTMPESAGVGSSLSGAESDVETGASMRPSTSSSDQPQMQSGGGDAGGSSSADRSDTSMSAYRVAPNTYATEPVVSPGDPENVGGGAAGGSGDSVGMSGDMAGSGETQDRTQPRTAPSTSGNSSSTPEMSAYGDKTSGQQGSGGGETGSVTRIEPNSARVDRPAYQCATDQECTALQSALAGDASGGIVRRGGVAVASRTSVAAKDMSNAPVVDAQGREIGDVQSVAIGKDGRIETILVGGGAGGQQSYAFNDVMLQRAEDGSAMVMARGTPSGKVVPAGMRLETLIGTELQLAGSTERARVDDVIYSRDGRPAGVVLRKGDVAGIGGKRVVVPYTSLQMQSPGQTPSLNISAADLDRMEPFYYSVAQR